MTQSARVSDVNSFDVEIVFYLAKSKEMMLRKTTPTLLFVKLSIKTSFLCCFSKQVNLKRKALRWCMPGVSRISLNAAGAQEGRGRLV